MEITYSSHYWWTKCIHCERKVEISVSKWRDGGEKMDEENDQFVWHESIIKRRTTCFLICGTIEGRKQPEPLYKPKRSNAE